MFLGECGSGRESGSRNVSEELARREVEGGWREAEGTGMEGKGGEKLVYNVLVEGEKSRPVI